MNVTCAGLDCGYPDRPVLRNVNLDFVSGTVTALLGPNGSGKSTLLKTLCKTIEPQKGEVRIGDQTLDSLSYSDLARLVAFVPQEETTQFHFTVFEVVLMGRMASSTGFLDTKEDREIAEWAMDEADCADLKHRPITELSGGERQRVFVARALAQKTGILLLDEPSSHLDVGHQVMLGELLRRLGETGLTIVVAVHDLNYASGIADRAVLISKGTVGMHDTCENILQSELLDEVYRVRFERFTDKNGTLRIFPERAVNSATT